MMSNSERPSELFIKLVEEEKVKIPPDNMTNRKTLEESYVQTTSGKCIALSDAYQIIKRGKFIGWGKR
jgi:hypothetical protein